MRNLNALENKNMRLLRTKFPKANFLIKLSEHKINYVRHSEDTEIRATVTGGKENGIPVTRSFNLTTKHEYFVRRVNQVDKRISDDCSICTKPTKGKTCCTRCSKDWCIDCYIELFKVGRGVITCPFCRESCGFVQPPYMIEIAAREIKQKWINL